MTTTRCSCWRRGTGMFAINGLLLLGIVSASIPDVMVLGSTSAKLVMEPDIPRKNCRYSKAFKMLQVNCSNLGIESVPSQLQTDIQIMDARVNRIRYLDSGSFAPYKKLAYLYLGDNFVQAIEEGVFSPLYYLEVVDLSKNGCDELPSDLFQLPYLRKVYLAENKLTNGAMKIAVTSPLSFVELSKNRLTRLPDFGVLPSLTHLYVAGNAIERVTVEDIAPYCSLQHLDLTSNPLKFDGAECTCQLLERWTKERRVRVVPSLNCTDAARCAAKSGYGNRTIELHENCTEILRVQVEMQRARSIWIAVASFVVAFIVLVFAVLYCIHRRNKRRQRELKEEQRLAADNANTELVNSNLRPDET